MEKRRTVSEGRYLMKIIHLCAADRFADNHSYQVNNLIKFHKMMGLTVEVIASCDTFNEKGELK